MKPVRSRLSLQDMFVHMISFSTMLAGSITAGIGSSRGLAVGLHGRRTRGSYSSCAGTPGHRRARRRRPDPEPRHPQPMPLIGK